MRRARLHACLLPLLLAACDGVGAREIGVERYDSAGVTVVLSTGEDRPLDWRFEPVRSLGGADDGPESFHGVGQGSVAFDDDGSIYVLDGANHRVVVFDRDGRHTRTLGRPGSGPGELGRFTLAVAVADDGTVGVYDMQRRAVIRWSADGEVLDALPIPGAVNGSSIALVDGRAYAAVDTRTDFDTPPVLQLRSFGAGEPVQLAHIEQAPSRPVAFRNCPVRISGMPAIFEPTLVWHASGSTFALSTSAAYELAVLEDGEPTRVVRRAVAPLTPSVELAAREVRDTMRIGFGGGNCAIPPEDVAEARGIADAVQLVKRVAVAPDGSVWVERRVFDRHDTRIDVFTADGAYAGTLPPDAKLPVAFRGADEFAVVERDELDVQHVVIYRILRG